MRRSTWTTALVLLLGAPLGACESLYTSVARDEPVDTRARLTQRIREAGQTALAAEGALLEPQGAEARGSDAPRDPARAERLDEYASELDRRVESIRDVASRLHPPDESVTALIGQFDQARLELSRTLDVDPQSPDGRATIDRAVTSLHQAAAGARQHAIDGGPAQHAGPGG